MFRIILLRYPILILLILICNFRGLAQSAQETKDWDRAVSIDTKKAYKDYLEKYPNGHYSDIVRNYVDQTGDFKKKIFARDLFFGKPATGVTIFALYGFGNNISQGFSFGSRFTFDLYLLNFRQKDKYNANSFSMADLGFSFSTSRKNGFFVEAGASPLYLGWDPTNELLQEVRELSLYTITTKEQVENLNIWRWDYFGGVGYRNSVGRINFGIQYRYRVINNVFDLNNLTEPSEGTERYNLSSNTHEIILRFGIDWDYTF